MLNKIMNSNTKYVGAAALGMGMAAAFAMGISKMNSPKRKMKKIVKKSAKALDNIMDNIKL